MTHISRRHLLVTAGLFGGGLAMGVIPAFELTAQDTGAPVEFSPRLVINPDDSITVIGTKPEAGQGTSTTLVVFVCEELGSDPLDMELVKMEFASVNREVTTGQPYAASTDKWHTWFYGRADIVREVYQQAGASARERLKAAASAAWNVPAAEITLSKNRLSHPAGHEAGIGQFAALAAAITLAAEPAVRKPEEWQLIGTAYRKRETPEKVSGRTVFGIDMVLPDMLFGAVVQAKWRGATIKSVNTAAAEAANGVHSVHVVTDFFVPSVVVLADSYWRAKKALALVEIEWEGGLPINQAEIDALYETGLIEAGVVAEDKGDALGTLAKAGQVFEATYRTPYREHAVMEPRNATAIYTPERSDYWCGSPSADSGNGVITRFAGVPAEQLHPHVVYVGGAYGAGRGISDAALAVIVAKTVAGRPVKLVWSREEHMVQGNLDAQQWAHMQMSVDADGWPEAFNIKKVGQSWGPKLAHLPEGVEGTQIRWMHTRPNLVNPTANPEFLDPNFKEHFLSPEKLAELNAQYYDGLAYEVPNHRVEFYNAPAGMPVRAMRSPGLSSTVFMVEGFIDEVAHGVGKDPVALRKHLLRNNPEPGWMKCIDLVCEKASWGKALPQGSGQGFAICVEHGAICAAVVEVTVAQAGDLTIDRIDIAFDTGYILNADGVLNQIEGGTLFGWNMALNEEVTLENGRFAQENFHTYPLLRIKDAPKNLFIHTEATSAYRPDAAVGEVTVPHMAAAVGNAIFAATGKRIRSLPYRKQDLSWR